MNFHLTEWSEKNTYFMSGEATNEIWKKSHHEMK